MAPKLDESLERILVNKLFELFAIDGIGRNINLNEEVRRIRINLY